jgi:Integrase core domain
MRLGGVGNYDAGGPQETSRAVCTVLCVAVENIDHTRTKARHPQTNGICERFHRTIQEEFYATAFRKKLYHGLEELQADLEEWIREYNLTHPFRHILLRKDPMQTVLDSAHLAQEKMLDSLRLTAPETERSPSQRSAGAARRRGCLIQPPMSDQV